MASANRCRKVLDRSEMKESWLNEIWCVLDCGQNDTAQYLSAWRQWMLETPLWYGLALRKDSALYVIMLALWTMF